MEESIFIKVLAYGETVGVDGVTEAEFLKWAESAGVHDHSGESRKTRALQRIFFEYFDSPDAVEGSREAAGSDCRYVLKPEYYFRLLEYRGRQENRAAVKSAHRHALWAVGLSLAAMIVCVILAAVQLSAPPTVSKADLAGLIESKEDANRVVRLDRLQMLQILTALGSNRPDTGTKRKAGIDPGREVSHHELINQYFENQ